jgi:hypothetical protein
MRAGSIHPADCDCPACIRRAGRWTRLLIVGLYAAAAIALMVIVLRTVRL